MNFTDNRSQTYRSSDKYSNLTRPIYSRVSQPYEFSAVTHVIVKDTFHSKIKSSTEISSTQNQLYRIYKRITLHQTVSNYPFKETEAWKSRFGPLGIKGQDFAIESIARFFSLSPSHPSPPPPSIPSWQRKASGVSKGYLGNQFTGRSRRLDVVSFFIFFSFFDGCLPIHGNFHLEPRCSTAPAAARAYFHQ